MPGNELLINGIAKFYVGDSKMPDLLKWLKNKGFPENKQARKMLKEKKGGEKSG